MHAGASYSVGRSLSMPAALAAFGLLVFGG
jgi:hypothetical protein